MSDGGSTLAVAAQNARNKLLGQILEAIKGLGIQIGAKSSSATAGSATLPANPAGFTTLTFSDGTTGKVPYYNP